MAKIVLGRKPAATTAAPELQDAGQPGAAQNGKGPDAPAAVLERVAPPTDEETRKLHAKRVNDSELKDVVAGAKVYAPVPEPEHLALTLLKDLGFHKRADTKGPFGELEALLKNMGVESRDRTEGARSSQRTRDVLLQASVLAHQAGGRLPEKNDLLRAMRSGVEPYSAQLNAFLTSYENLEANAIKEGQWLTKEDMRKTATLFPVLSSLGKELVGRAVDGELDPAVGRNEMVGELLISFFEGEGSSPVLVGEAGVGKTAILEGLALMIAHGELEGRYKNARIFNVAATELLQRMGATQCSQGGQAGRACASVIEQIIAEVKTGMDQKPPVPVIIMIDEIHQLAQNQAVLSQMEALKPYLARGELVIAGATTHDEWKSTIGKSPALKRRFRKHTVEEPDRAGTLQMVLSKFPRYGTKYGVRIDASAAQAAVEFSRYTDNPEEKNPSAAVKLLRNACARVAFQLEEEPPRIAKLSQDVKDAERAMQHAEGSAVGRADEQVRKDLADSYGRLSSELRKLRQQAVVERPLVLEGIRLEKEISELRLDPNADPAKLDDLALKLEANRRALDKLYAESGDPLYHLVVDADAVMHAASKLSGVPLDKLKQNEDAKFEEGAVVKTLQRHVVGQDHILEGLEKEIRADRAKTRDPNRPIGAHIFLGPTGVGKTTLAEALAEEYFGGVLVTYKGNQLQEGHTTAVINGAPPGYVGYEEGSSLAVAARHYQRGVLLIDEIEKAHPKVRTLLMEIKDKGFFMDENGRKVDMRNWLILETSNLGTAELQELAGDGKWKDQAEAEAIVARALTSPTVYHPGVPFAAPEQLGRYTGGKEGMRADLFNPLGQSQMPRIVDKLFRQLKEQQRSANRINLGLAPELREFLSVQGYSRKEGARALGTLFARTVRDALTDELNKARSREGGEGRFADGAYLQAYLAGDRALFRPMSAEERALEVAQAAGEHGTHAFAPPAPADQAAVPEGTPAGAGA